jgi:hypothetical protein
MEKNNIQIGIAAAHCENGSGMKSKLATTFLAQLIALSILGRRGTSALSLAWTSCARLTRKCWASVRRACTIAVAPLITLRTEVQNASDRTIRCRSATRNVAQ